MTTTAPIADQLRGTGRTTRTILQALIWASEGKPVAFVSATTTIARSQSRQARLIAEAAGILAPESNAMTVRIGTGNGHIRFTSIDESRSGTGYPLTIHDHRAWEVKGG